MRNVPIRSHAQRGRPYGASEWVATTAGRLGLGFTLRGVARPAKVRAEK